MNWDPPVPPAVQRPPDEEGEPSWYRRRLWKLPMWAWLVIALVVVFAATSGGADDEAVAPIETEPQETEPQQTEPAAAESDVVEIPPLQATGCPAVDSTVASDVNAALDPGLSLGLASSDSSAGVTWLLGSIYRESDGERVSSADTWASIDGQVYAVSGSANEYSGLPDGGGVVPDAFSDDTRADIETCVTDAIING